MAITLHADTERASTLDEFLDEISRNMDPDDQDSVMAQAPALRALANNRTFVTEKLNAQLAAYRDFQATNSYSAGTMMLGHARTPGVYVRANIWAPPATLPGVRDYQNELFAYLIPHNHNFDFLTVGYLGAGYETVIYDFEPDGVVGVPGEKVPLHFLERTSLPQGKVMFYRAGRDVHCQHHPKEFSISLNLMIGIFARQRTEQYVFDFETQRITGHVDNGASSRVLMCELAGYVGDGRTTNLLEGLARQHASQGVRAASYQSLAKLEPGSAPRLWTEAVQDRHELVRQAARKALAHMEGQA